MDNAKKISRVFRFKEDSKVVTIEMCALEKISHNIELLAGQVAMMSQPSSNNLRVYSV